MNKVKISILALIVLAAGAGGLWIYDHNTPERGQELVALGDSLTYGVGDQSGAGYAENLEEVVNENREEPLTVYNYGIPGQQTDGLLAQLEDEEVKATLKNAEYFTVFIGTNDLIKTNGGDLNPLYDDRIQTGKEDYEKNLEEILTILREENPEAPILFLGLFNPYPENEEIQQIIDDWNNLSKSMVEEYPRVKFIATDGILKEKSTEYFSDALHPNEKGYELITKRMIEEYDF
ncbi:GDSL-like lipase/acylhydrolase [Jeotgalibacillus malaysiensis]|uniref:GDSL-like lipase/acylhydrolase n=1 Tax=Jeotgalibacillus malaysiensis TaxID=1508404 RepID=A0A0B5AMT2_9BACL|nr:GDSL-type esterase/lipase family protein [Jeotgalibacillus malaysiensis]AJD89823.1 GDSL-like lipase/acylhydrolase [Jeotgalibacillus malaysiensis]